MTGIVAYGGYVPRLRLSRQAVVEANSWFNPGIARLAKGERAICNWDEDALTMAVEAARDCLAGADVTLGAAHLASTTLPFADRQNAGILAGALNLDEAIQTIDVTASQRAGTSGLIAALASSNNGQGSQTLYVASEARRAKTSGTQELMIGDGAAALLLGSECVIAELVAAHQIAVDFVDHYRGQNEEFDYAWEERWIRDEGYLKIVPRALEGLFAKTDIEPGAIDHFVMPSVMPAVPPRIAKMAGIPEGAVRDTLHGAMGEAGTAHALVMLVDALQDARPGQTILVVGWGQGCDVLLFRATDALADLPPRQGIKGYLARRREETNYNRYLAFRGLITQDKGIRAEADISTPPSALYRKREMITGFVGGRCRTCGTAQFPKSNVCVNPNCGEFHSQEPMPFADIPAKILSWTADNLTYSPDPPAHFGMVTFEEGGRLMADLTDVDVGGVSVGMPMRMVFRVKDRDERRGFTKYFWKAAPDHTKV
ncbi:MAG TPA: OB-fold domain-containing protein [Alphaproteobacteria bacterium]|nr:OB-fold domain-containing protein [Alphaproteobacteria bacterium]